MIGSWVTCGLGAQGGLMVPGRPPRHYSARLEGGSK